MHELWASSLWPLAYQQGYTCLVLCDKIGWVVLSRLIAASMWDVAHLIGDNLLASQSWHMCGKGERLMYWGTEMLASNLRNSKKSN